MGHYVEYVLDLPGTKFAETFPNGVLSADGVWEGSIPKSNGVLVGQTDGLVTCLTYAEIKYSWLLAADEESVACVSTMDAALKNSFPDFRILRIDQFLLDQWALLQGEDFRMAANGFDDLLQWMDSQDRLHWAVVS